MDDYLREKFGWIGDTKLAELFEKRFPKHYGWTKKHIERRRSYMKLKRTKEQEHYLRCLNNKDGRHFKMWEKRNKMKEGEVREWDGRKYIRHKGKTLLYSRYVTKAKKGQIARWTGKEYQVISMAEHAVMNKRNSMELPPDLKEAVKALNQLKKIVYGKENSRPERNPI